MKKQVMIFAGELSGDRHAAHLIRDTLKIDPDVEFAGMGGPEMAAAGCEILVDPTEHAVCGIVEVASTVKWHYRNFKNMEAALSLRKPDCAVFVDNPEFNLPLAKRAKRLGVKTVYYVSPQLWAWRKGRVNIVRRFVDKMIPLFDFERDWYRQHGVDAEWYGHPIVDQLEQTSRELGTVAEIRHRWKFAADAEVLGLLPGSRKKELTTLLPTMLKAAELLQRERRNLHVVLGLSPAIDQAHLENFQNRISRLDRFTCLQGRAHEVMKGSSFCFVASGTATLETACLETPLMATYKASFLTIMLLAPIVQVPFFSLVNLVARREVIPERYLFDATAPRFRDAYLDYVLGRRYRDMKRGLKIVKERLGKPGATERIALAFVEFLHKRRLSVRNG